MQLFYLQHAPTTTHAHTNKSIRIQGGTGHLVFGNFLFPLESRGGDRSKIFAWPDTLTDATICQTSLFLHPQTEDRRDIKPFTLTSQILKTRYKKLTSIQ